LGDPQAQNDLAHCYHNGHGTKKDVFMAAKYYRLADKQGHGIMGNSWIWKSKYDSP
jgi:TPR repeat protein